MSKYILDGKIAVPCNDTIKWAEWLEKANIPPEALEAGKDTAFAWLRSHMEDDVRVQQMTDEELTEFVSAACLAMLKSWPGMLDSWSVFEEERQIILPLTQESGE